MATNKKVLVTGGGGYIGRHVVAALLDLGLHVYVADPSYVSQGKHDYKVDAPIFSGDKNIFKQMGSPDVLVHLAWRDGFKHNADTHITNLPLHYRFLQDMVDGGLKQIVGMGSMHEIGYHEGTIDEATATNPQSLYGIAKNALRQTTALIAAQNQVVYQWVRGFYITGDDSRSQSVFRKILEAEARQELLFPFVSGKNKYDFIDVEELGRQIAAVAAQTEVQGIINCCSGSPVSLAERAEQFIKDNNLKIQLQYGAFPDRPYDSPGVWGDATKIKSILAKAATTDPAAVIPHDLMHTVLPEAQMQS